MSRRIKTTASSVAAPRDQAEADRFLAEIGAAQRARLLIEKAAEETIAAVRERMAAEAAPHAARIEALTRGLQLWAEANRERLTATQGRKTIVLPSGQFGWRLRPPSVRVKAVAEVIEALKRLGLTRFIRVKEEVNKEAILAEPNVAMNVPGLTIGSAGEDFFVEPITEALEDGARAT